jgi:myosin heavy subunit
VAKCVRRRKADGSWVCARCKLQGSKVEAELHDAQKERDQAAEKARESSLLLKEEKNKRLKLEDKITQRLCRGGRYKLEGLDAAIVPDGVVAYELEEAQRQMREASEAASRIANKLAVERQEKRDIVRQARKERVDLVEDMRVRRALQAEFEKTAKRRTIQAEISEREARAEQDRLAENCSEYRELLETERQEKREIIREDRKRIANLCTSLEVAESQKAEHQKAANRRARQAECAETRARNASELLMETKSSQDKLSSKLAHLQGKRKLEKQASRRREQVEDGSVRLSASVNEKLEQQLRLALEENELLEADLADVCGMITLFSICEAHFQSTISIISLHLYLILL